MGRACSSSASDGSNVSDMQGSFEEADDSSISSSDSVAYSFEGLDIIDAEKQNQSVEEPATTKSLDNVSGVSFPDVTRGLPKIQLGSLQQSQDVVQTGKAHDASLQGKPGLRNLNLGMICRDNVPKDETRLKQDKLAKFEVLCSEVAPGICIGGEKVASNKQLLKEAGITHIINCVGMVVPNYFPDEFSYHTLFLKDDGVEDLTSLFYQVFDFIQEARQSGGGVLVHCIQGVSRSVTFVIAYLMWQNKKSYGDVFEAVKAIRGVANPNIGFCFQLRTWHMGLNKPTEEKAYTIAQHSCNPQYPSCLIARRIKGELNTQHLRPQQVIILHQAQQQYIWKGGESHQTDVAAAENCAKLFARYEDKDPAIVLEQGSETSDFRKAFKMPLQRPPLVPHVKLPLVATSSSALNSARSESGTPKSSKSKTPRTERSAHERSPRRKTRRSDNSEGSRENYNSLAEGIHMTVRSEEACPDIGGRLWCLNSIKFPFLSKWLASNLETSKTSQAKSDGLGDLRSP